MREATIDLITFHPSQLVHLGVLVCLGSIFFVFMRKDEMRSHFWLAFAFKIMAGISLGWIHAFFYGNADTFSLFRDGVLLSKMAMSDWDSYRFILFDAQDYEYTQLPSAIENPNPRALFTSKWLSVFNLITESNYIATGFYFSFCAFIGLWLFAKAAYEITGDAWASAIGCLYWPNVLFWASGISKESLMLAYIGVIVFLFYRLGQVKYAQQEIVEILLLFLFAYWLFRLKYYYAAVLIPVGFGWAFSKRYRTVFNIPSGLFILGLGGGAAFFISFLHPNLVLTRLPTSIVTNHDIILAASPSYNIISFNNLNPSWTSIITNSPQALWESIARPYIWEGGNLLKIAASVESFVVLIGLAFCLFLAVKRNYWKFPSLLWMAVLAYILILLALLALASPNLGTLSRYKSGVTPFLITAMIYYIRRGYLHDHKTSIHNNR